MRAVITLHLEDHEQIEGQPCSATVALPSLAYKIHGKVDGYGYGPAFTSPGYHSQKLYDGNGDPAEQGQLQVCRVISAWPDNCTSSAWYYR